MQALLLSRVRPFEIATVSSSRFFFLFYLGLVSVLPRRVNQVLATVGQQVLLVAVDLHGAVDLPRVDVHAVLTLLGEGDRQRDDVPRRLVTHIL